MNIEETILKGKEGKVREIIQMLDVQRKELVVIFCDTVHGEKLEEGTYQKVTESIMETFETAMEYSIEILESK